MSYPITQKRIMVTSSDNSPTVFTVNKAVLFNYSSDSLRLYSVLVMHLFFVLSSFVSVNIQVLNLEEERCVPVASRLSLTVFCYA